jgi:peptidylprolyl isomerase
MIPQSGDTVLVRHRVTTSDGELIESSFDSQQPFRFTIDSGRVIRGMNDTVREMAEGTSTTVVIPASLAHGEYIPSKYRAVRKTAFYQGVQIGQTLTFQGDLGQPVKALVLREEGESLILDMNHPLAGKDLTLEVELIEVIKDDSQEPFI